jgi:hypothetical protein
VRRSAGEKLEGIETAWCDPYRGSSQYRRPDSSARWSNTVFRGALLRYLPSVSWVMPVIGRAEHPPDNIQDGMSWVTKIVNS